VRIVEAGGRRLSAEAAEAQFKRMFNVDHGRRNLTCKSRLQIPESIVQSERKDEWPRIFLCTAMRKLGFLCQSSYNVEGLSARRDS
jgi:hypothetical protein